MRISEVMVTDVTVVAPETTIDAAAQIMADLDFGALPIGRPRRAARGHYHRARHPAASGCAAA